MYASLARQFDRFPTGEMITLSSVSLLLLSLFSSSFFHSIFSHVKFPNICSLKTIVFSTEMKRKNAKLKAECSLKLASFNLSLSTQVILSTCFLGVPYHCHLNNVPFLMIPHEGKSVSCLCYACLLGKKNKLCSHRHLEERSFVG